MLSLFWHPCLSTHYPAYPCTHESVHVCSVRCLCAIWYRSTSITSFLPASPKWWARTWSRWRPSWRGSLQESCRPCSSAADTSCSPTNHPAMCYPFSLNLEKHEWSWDNAAHREMPEACRRLSYVFSLHWVLNRRVHSLSLYLTAWNTWMNYSCFKHYSSNALQWTCFFHNASPSTRSFIQRFLSQAKVL